MTEAAGEKPFEILRRWEDSGGTWRIVRHDGTSVDLELLTCSGGEVMGRLRTDDPDVLAHVERAESP
jgi:hypothetical protein